MTSHSFVLDNDGNIFKDHVRGKPFKNKNTKIKL